MGESFIARMNWPVFNQNRRMTRRFQRLGTLKVLAFPIRAIALRIQVFSDCSRAMQRMIRYARTGSRSDPSIPAARSVPGRGRDG